MSDVMVLAHVLDILISLLVDRGYLFEAERKTFNNLLDKLEQTGKEADDEIGNLLKALEQEPCEDAISRRAVINEVDNYIEKAQSTSVIDDFISFEELVVKVLPPVTPKQKMRFDGMTNGEVIDLLFPGADIYHNRDFTLREMIFPDEWWDAPYKAESEEADDGI